MQLAPRYPSLYQINTRVWLTELSRTLGRRATLDDIPDKELDQLAQKGFDWVWLLSVWQTGQAAQHVSRTNTEWRKEFQATLPDLKEEDIAGSGFAITGYTVHANLGGDSALARLRTRLKQRGLRLLLDFVPNHMALDHPWVFEHPEYFVHGTELDLARSPKNYTRINSKQGALLLAHGRDPYFPGWPDTVQLNYANPATHQAMIEVLLKISDQCDGVRCDMAMLVLPDVFEKTWGKPAPAFWARAIEQVRSKVPYFCFMAEVYWDLEWTLQQLGFDYTYDKRLYDRLEHRQTRAAREHLQADMDYQNKMVRFLENHDEPRAAATFPFDVHQAAAAITYLSPGLRFFHQGQLQGYSRRISPHLCRGPAEPVNSQVQDFYDRLLAILKQPVVREGTWQKLDGLPAWEGNWTSDCFIHSCWHRGEDDWLLISVNYAPNQSQCYIKLPIAHLRKCTWILQDMLSDARYERDGSSLHEQGLFLDMRPWQACVFSIKTKVLQGKIN